MLIKISILLSTIGGLLMALPVLEEILGFSIERIEIKLSTFSHNFINIKSIKYVNKIHSIIQSYILLPLGYILLVFSFIVLFNIFFKVICFSELFHITNLLKNLNYILTYLWVPVSYTASKAIQSMLKLLLLVSIFETGLLILIVAPRKDTFQGNLTYKIKSSFGDFIRALFSLSLTFLSYWFTLCYGILLLGHLGFEPTFPEFILLRVC